MENQMPSSSVFGNGKVFVKDPQKDFCQTLKRARKYAEASPRFQNATSYKKLQDSDK